MTGLFVLLVGCTERESVTGPLLPNPLLKEASVSNPLPRVTEQSGAQFSATLTTSPGVTYVSLPPGTVPNGVFATIRNRRTELTIGTVMEDGGFDPVPVAAIAEDTVDMVVEQDGGSTITISKRVPSHARPRVVRTDPPPGKRDVPLNSQIMVVFSEPVQPGSEGAITVTRGGSRVPGQVTLTADGLRASFRPTSDLAPNTVYELSISTDLTDVDGETLAELFRMDFRTGTTRIVASIATNPTASYTPSNLELRTLTIRAERDNQGVVSGRFAVLFPGMSARQFGRVTCFTIGGSAMADARATWIGVVVESSWIPNRIGKELGLVAVDHGPDGTPDAVSSLWVLGTSPGAPWLDSASTGTKFCANAPNSRMITQSFVPEAITAGDVVVNPAGPAPPPAPNVLSEIAYASPHGGIQVMSADATAGRVLTTTVGDFSPSWSPDGLTIAFDREAGGTGSRDIYVINANGTGLRQLTFGPDDESDPAWSPDGSTIAFGMNGAIYTMRTGPDTARTRLTSGGYDSHPTWSPDGSRIAFASSRSGKNAIYVMSANGSGVSQLTSDSANDYTPWWSPNDNTIAFQRGESGRGTVYVINADGTDLRQVTPLGRTPSWSPDGRVISFEQYGLTTVNLDGSGMVRLGNGFDPAWSPIGKMPPRAFPSVTIEAVAGDNVVDSVAALTMLKLRAWRGEEAPAVGVKISWYLPPDPTDPHLPFLSRYFSTTDESGFASVDFTRGKYAPRAIIVRAAVTDGSGRTPGIEFHLGTKAGNPAALVQRMAIPPLTLSGSSLTYVVTAFDTHGDVASGGQGNPISDLPITWAVTAGDGSITPTQDVLMPRDSSQVPISRATQTLGPSEGVNTVTATAATVFGAPHVSFTTTVVSEIVAVRDGGFSADSIAVPAGKTVGWDWGSFTFNAHNVTFEDDATGSLSSPTQTAGIFTRQFTGVARTIRYRCTRHSTSFTQGEVGRVTVQ